MGKKKEKQKKLELKLNDKLRKNAKQKKLDWKLKDKLKKKEKQKKLELKLKDKLKKNEKLKKPDWKLNAKLLKKKLHVKRVDYALHVTFVNQKTTFLKLNGRNEKTVVNVRTA